MLDPSDVEIRSYREGTADTGEFPIGGPMGEPATGDLSSEHQVIPIFRVMSDLFVNGTERQVDADDRPAYWSVKLLNDANAKVIVWPYPAPAGPGITLYPGDSTKLAGLSQQIFIRSTGSATANVQILAVRGWPEGLGVGF